MSYTHTLGRYPHVESITHIPLSDTNITYISAEYSDELYGDPAVSRTSTTYVYPITLLDFTTNSPREVAENLNAQLCELMDDNTAKMALLSIKLLTDMMPLLKMYITVRSQTGCEYAYNIGVYPV